MKSERIVADTYAWIEYFLGTALGEKVKKYIEGEYELLTPVIVLAELREYSLRHRKDFTLIYAFIQARSKIVPVNQQIAIKAVEINYERKGMEKIRGWGMIDSTVLATAQIHKAKVLTGDPHFKNLKETIWLSKHP